MSRGNDEEGGRERERGREGLKEREGWRLQRSSRHGRCQLQHSLSLFSPKAKARVSGRPTANCAVDNLQLHQVRKANPA